MLLQEDDFSLEFHTVSIPGSIADNPLSSDAVGSNGYVLQERIIVPPHLSGEAAVFSARTVAPMRCNAPLIFVGHPDLPVQCSSVIARPKKGKSEAEKYDAAIKITSEGMRLLFSAPIFSTAGTSRGFLTAFDGISEVLSACRMKESAIVRTWLFMEDTLRDYELLNRARERFYKKWFSSPDHIIPASTGIQGHIIGSPVLSVDFCAFSGERLSIRQQFSPLQNEPTDYGKLFSRAVVVRFPNNALVFISGTAPIDRTGASVHIGNFERQMVHTLEALYAILRDAGGNFSSVVQAVVYLKSSKDMDSCTRILADAGFPRSRALFQLGVDICRDDLLCEVEVTAVI